MTTGTEAPEMGTSSPVAALDWDQTKVTVTEDGRTTYTFPTLSGWIVSHSGWIVYLEATFESYDPAERNRCIDLAGELGVELRTFRPLSTAHRRWESGLEKSDETDSLMIWRTAHETARHWKRPVKRNVSLEDELAQLDLHRRQVWMRNSGYANTDAQRVANYLALNWPSVDGRRLGRPLALSAALAAEHVLLRGGSRKDFDRAMALYGAGYPGQGRSNFYYHTIGGRVRAGDDRKAAMKAYRCEVRRIFHIVGQGMNPPETGTEATQTDTTG